MNSINWQIQTFNQLSTDQLFDLLKLRVDVFIVEQHCPYPELDNKDKHSETLHVAAYSDTNEIIACARLLAPGLSYDEVSIGRFAVAETMRHQGLAEVLLNQCLNAIDHHWPNKDIRISAQTYLKAFYEQFDFKTVSETYMEDGIPHIEMLKRS